MSWKTLFNGYWFARVILVLWMVSCAFIMFLLWKIDGIVHGDLYNFGLQFSYAWAQPYWAFLRLIYVCLAVPMFLSGIILVFSVFRRVDVERPVVKRVEAAPSVRSEALKGNHMVVSCPKCKRVFGKPLVMLDFSGDQARLVNVCPYCNHVLGCADEEEQDDVRVADLDKEVVRKR